MAVPNRTTAVSVFRSTFMRLLADSSALMILDAVLTPAEIDLLPQSDLSKTVCVVFDVLRATSSMITGLANGAEEIWPVSTIEEALAARLEWPDALLGGERFGDRIEGFDLGNSPLEYCRPGLNPKSEVVGDELMQEAEPIGLKEEFSVFLNTVNSDERPSRPANCIRSPRSTSVFGLKRIITTTTNGTVALRACSGTAGAQAVFAGALLNMEALVNSLRQTEPERVLLICAGTFRTMALEDVIAAGMLASAFPEAVKTDAAEVTLASYEKHAGNLLAGLRGSTNGRKLLENGRGDDVDWCAQVSRYPLVGVMTGGIIRRG